MNLAIKKMIEGRTSVSKYVKHEMSQSEIKELVRLACLSPSAYNLQNWKFIAVQSYEAKQRLKDAAYGQTQVLDASVTFIVCGVLDGYSDLNQTLQMSVDNHIIPPMIAQSWVEAVTQSHQNNQVLQRDEAIRSASLASMTLMYAAQASGYDSGAMGGFNADQVKDQFKLNHADIPVMLVTIGKADTGNWSQKIRKPVESILQIA